MRITAAALVAVAACSSSDGAPKARDLVDLSAGLDAVRTEFNAHKHEARFLTLLAPT